jgi:hypothetical protein
MYRGEVSAAPDAPQRSDGRPWLVAAIMAIVLLVLIGLGWYSASNHSTPELSLPILAMAGIVGLFIAVALVAIAFSAFGLSDSKQAMGLPEGSVRALIALSLLVLFAILSVFLYVSLASEKQIGANLSAADVKKFTDALTPEQRSTVTVRVSGSAAGTPATPTYSMFLQDASSQARQDIAKQLLGIIGTLLSAIAGFYFGAGTVSSTVDKTNKANAANAANAGNDTSDGNGGGSPAGGSPGDTAAELAALSAVVGRQSAAVSATPAAAALGQDPRLASESDPKKQSKGIVS